MTNADLVNIAKADILISRTPATTEVMHAILLLGAVMPHPGEPARTVAFKQAHKELAATETYAHWYDENGFAVVA